MNTDAGRRSVDTATLVIGVLLIAGAETLRRDAAAMSGGIATYGIGPTAMTYVVAAGLGILGLGHLLAGVRSGAQEREGIDLSAVAWIGGAVAALIFGLDRAIGFVPGVTLLFAATARGFRNDRSLAMSNRLAALAALGFLLVLGIPLLGVALPVAGLKPALVVVGWISLALLLAGLFWPPRTQTGLKDAAIGFVLSLIVYLAFTKLLTLSLPQGPLERLL